MHIATIALIGTLALEGRAQVRLLPIARFAGVSAALLAVRLIGIGLFMPIYLCSGRTVHERRGPQGKNLLVNPQPSVVYSEVPEAFKEAGSAPAARGEKPPRWSVIRDFLGWVD